MPSNSDEYHHVLDFIETRSSYARGFITSPSSRSGGPELGLERMRALLAALGDPNRAYPIVHVAGSKGKGSTGAFLAAIGASAGYRTGLSTSPHLHSFRERIAINGLPIGRDDFARIGIAIELAAESIERKRPELGLVSAFELLTAMALLAFSDAGCDLAVVEVGLGGTFDSTNVVTPAVSVITRLDLEHTQVLGETIAEIAENKAGIIKSGVPVVTAHQVPAAMAVIEPIAHEHDAPLFVAERDFRWSGDWRAFEWATPERRIPDLRTGMPGNHQMENAALAISTWTLLADRGFRTSDDAISRGVAAASLPGRFERFERDGHVWVLDGAHTPVAAAALAEAVLSEFGRPGGVIAGMLRDKHPDAFFVALAPAVEALIVTSPDNPRAISADELLLTGRTVDSQAIASLDLETSLTTARALFPEGLPIVITGSFTLVAEARERFGLALSDL